MVDPADVDARPLVTMTGIIQLEAGVAYRWRIVNSDDPNLATMEVTRPGEAMKVSDAGPNRNERRTRNAIKRRR
jgi:hypothetical protein